METSYSYFVTSTQQDERLKLPIKLELIAWNN